MSFFYACPVCLFDAARDTLNAGFTTVRDVGSSRDGDTIRPRMLLPGYALGIKETLQHNLIGPDYKKVAIGVADGPWAAPRRARWPNRTPI